LRLFSFECYGLALAALALVVFGAIEFPPPRIFKDAGPLSFDVLFGKVAWFEAMSVGKDERIFRPPPLIFFT